MENDDVAAMAELTERLRARYNERFVPKATPEFHKDDAGKARIDLIPPEFVFQTAHVLAIGAKKYGDNNWARGANWSRYYAAMQRHLWAWWSGEEGDPETGHSHLAHAACCLAFLVAYETRNIGKDDRQIQEVNNEH